MLTMSSFALAEDVGVTIGLLPRTFGVPVRSRIL